MVFGGNGQLVGAHFVGCVSVGHHTVGSHDDSWGCMCVRNWGGATHPSLGTPGSACTQPANLRHPCGPWQRLPCCLQ
jgi:hypothetical protein